MKMLDAEDIKNLNLLKHYRIIRKWACRNNDLTDAEIELLIYLDSIDMFYFYILLYVHYVYHKTQNHFLL